jgi:hypothetical protein
VGIAPLVQKFYGKDVLTKKYFLKQLEDFLQLVDYFYTFDTILQSSEFQDHSYGIE